MQTFNHEMMRELLWREYPTDQRGSVFRSFWGAWDSNLSETATEERRSIKPIHQWRAGGNLTNLGKNFSGSSDPSDWLILGIRSELLQKYPNTSIYAQKAKWVIENGVPDINQSRKADESLEEYSKQPLVIMKFGDITFLGFDLTMEEAKGNRYIASPDPGWFFAFKEIAGEISFGLNKEPAPVLKKWSDLDWAFFPGELVNLNINPVPIPTQEVEDIPWGRNAADMAWIFHREANMVLIHASKLLT